MYWLLMLLFNANAPPAAVKLEGVDIDETTRGRLIACRARLLEARQDAKSGRAKFVYVRHQGSHKPPYLVDEFEGELIWKGNACKYIAYPKGKVDQFDFAAIRNERESFVARWTGMNGYSFEATRPKRDLNELSKESGIAPALVDPNVFWESGIAYLWAPSKGVKLRSTNANDKIVFTLEVYGASGAVKGRSEYSVYANTLLPFEIIRNDLIDGQMVKVLSKVRTWRQYSGIWHPETFTSTYHYPPKNGVQKDFPTTVRFTELLMNVEIADREVAAESLPLPEGLMGVDARVPSKVPLYFSKKGVTRERPPEHATLKVNTPDASLNEATEAEIAQQMRNRYYYQLAGAVSGGIAIVAIATAAVVYWMRRWPVTR